MLTKEQEIAANSLWEEPRVVVQLIAGAGSGKTTTLIETVVRGIHSGIAGENICMITFTRKAANEMKERMARRNVRVGFTGTMHSLGYQIIRTQSRGNMKIIRHPEAIHINIVRQIFPQYSHIPSSILVRNDFLNEDDLKKFKHHYREFKKKRNLIDMDDLIVRSANIIRKDPGLFPYRVVLVDEFQDTSPDQLEFIRSMAFDKLFVVGDDWQSIYGFRGADVSIAHQFPDYFTGARRLFLKQNFRSQKHIVKLGNNAIQLSTSFIQKKLTAFHKPDKKPVCHIIEGLDGSDDPLFAWKIYQEKYVTKPHNRSLTILVRTNRLRNVLLSCVPPDVEVLTIHASKGMEFDNVLIFGIAKDIFPHKWNDFNEEVRLLYVAITRARKGLEFLTWEKDDAFSAFVPFLVKHCRLNYLTTSWRDPLPMA